jgi:hypothetical protein
MSSKSQGWNPPMAAQDEIVDLLIETYPDNKMTTFGAAAFNGCMLMNDEYGGSGEAETDAWHVFGDPSIQVRTNTPTEMDARHNVNIDVGTWSLEVEVVGVEGALCAISRNNELFGCAYTDEDGLAIVVIDESAGYDPLDLVITSYNMVPYEAEIMVNTPPEIPDRPEGPTEGKPNVEYTFTTSTTDFDEDQVYYMWRWGDGTYSEWLGPFNSGETAEASHSWDDTANYQIRVKAKDTVSGSETDWSEPLTINVPRSKSINRPFLNFLENHPNLFPLLRQLLGL